MHRFAHLVFFLRSTGSCQLTWTRKGPQNNGDRFFLRKHTLFAIIIAKSEKRPNRENRDIAFDFKQSQIFHLFLKKIHDFILKYVTSRSLRIWPISFVWQEFPFRGGHPNPRSWIFEVFLDSESESWMIYSSQGNLF